MLDIVDRSCDVTQHMNVRGQNLGEDVQTAVDVMLKNIALTADETNTVFKDPDAYDRLFRKREDSDMLEPVFKLARGMPINYKIESARIEINTGHGKPIVLPECALGRLFVTWSDGGKVTLAAQVQCVPNIDAAGGRLLKLIGANVQISIKAQNEQQALELPEGKGRAVSGVFKPARNGKQTDAHLRARTREKANGNVTPIAGRRKRKQAATTPQEPPAAS